MTHNHFERALGLVMMMLRSTQAPTAEDIKAKVALVLTMLKQEDASFDIDPERLIRHVRKSLQYLHRNRDVASGSDRS